jgi:hypothetical protein
MLVRIAQNNMKMLTHWRLLAALLGLRSVAVLAIAASGFYAVSDDDFARCFIAQEFSWTPKLDPSGTSWLPFPFWWTGSWMRLLSLRSFEAARVAGGLFAAIASGYCVDRLLRSGLRGAAFSGALVLLFPWQIWLGSAALPDSSVSLLIAGVTFALVMPGGLKKLDVVAMSVACLSRYEAWPAACVVFALSLLRAQPRLHKGWLLGLVLGPCLWCIWNLHAHGSLFHFWSRVATFRAAEQPLPLSVRALYYPLACWKDAPLESVAILVCVASLALPSRLGGAAEARNARLLGMAVLVGMFAFLVVGSVRDGAPTHHPIRACLACFAIGVPLFIDAFMHQALRWSDASFGKKTILVAFVAALGLVWCASVGQAVQNFPSDPSRRALVLQGQSFALGASPERRLVLTPCAYEHFAFAVGFADPRRIQMMPKAAASHAQDGPCPQVRLE